MLNRNNVNKIISYWADNSKYDLATAKGLFKIKRYPYCLFMCHLSLEKILKALVTAISKEHAPFTHNLTYLAEKSGLDFSEDDYDLLAEINEFNIEARYPDIKAKFYKKANRKLAEKYIKKTEGLSMWIRKNLEKSSKTM